MPLLLKVACPDCGRQHDCAALGTELRCQKCGRDFRAAADGDGAGKILSVTPEEMDNVPYSQRAIEIPVNSVSSVFVADPALLTDRALRDAPLRDNARWLGKVRLLKKLGQGGMGAVYRGYDESLALDVAVKVLPMPAGARDDSFVQRFRQEARISAQINHPNVVRTLSVDEQGDMIYLVMDYIEGQTARYLAESKGPLAVPMALQIIHDASKGMQAAHQHGIVHRDIKPDNILVSSDGRVLLSDLGLAKAVSSSGHGTRIPVTRLGLLLGTPEYMSPEQWDIGTVVGAASDIWSMGATLWMLLTQKPPFDEKDMAVMARKVKDAPLPNLQALRPGLPEAVTDVLFRCLAKRPQDRFADAAELLAALDWAMDNLTPPPGAPPKPSPYRLDESPQQLLLPFDAAAESASRSPSGAMEADAAQAGAVAETGEAAGEAAAEAAAANGESTPASQGRATRFIYAPRAGAPPAPPRANLNRPKTWLALPALALLGLGGWGVASLLRRPPAPPLPAVAVVAPLSIEPRCPTHIRPGQEAELSVALSGGGDPADLAVTWETGDRAFSGRTVRVPLEQDTEFTVVVRDKSGARIVKSQMVKIEVDLEAIPGEQDQYEIVTGTPLKLQGRVRGGSGGADAVEARWIDTDSPDKALCAGLAFELPQSEEYLQPRRRTFALQVRRKGASGWSDAATGRVGVEITRRIPPEFTAAVNDGSLARDRAVQSATGVEAISHWQKALAAFEKACAIFDEKQAPIHAEQCRQRIALEEKYLALLHQAGRLREAAEAVPESDGVRQLTAWADARQPCLAAVTLFDRPEARGQLDAVESRLARLKNVLETAEQQRQVFDRMVSKARFTTKEAHKYLNPSVALPYWEDSLALFQDLSRRFPKRADEFVLELKEVEENHDKAYLYDSFGIVPVKPGQKSQDLKPKAPIGKTLPHPATPAAPAAPTAPSPRATPPSLPGPAQPGRRR